MRLHGRDVGGLGGAGQTVHDAAPDLGGDRGARGGEVEGEGGHEEREAGHWDLRGLSKMTAAMGTAIVVSDQRAIITESFR